MIYASQVPISCALSHVLTKTDDAPTVLTAIPS